MEVSWCLCVVFFRCFEMYLCATLEIANIWFLWEFEVGETISALIWCSFTDFWSLTLCDSESNWCSFPSWNRWKNRRLIVWMGLVAVPSLVILSCNDFGMFTVVIMCLKGLDLWLGYLLSFLFFPKPTLMSIFSDCNCRARVREIKTCFYFRTEADIESVFRMTIVVQEWEKLKLVFYFRTEADIESVFRMQKSDTLHFFHSIVHIFFITHSLSAIGWCINNYI